MSIVLLCCRCGCGRPTLKLRPAPGSILQSKFFGFITGHENRPDVSRTIIGPDEIGKRRRAEVLVNSAEAAGLIDRRVGATAAIVKKRLETARRLEEEKA